MQGPWSRTKVWIGLAVFGAALTIAILRVTALPSWFGVRLSMPWAMNDFKTAIYCPTAMFLQGGNPYDTEQFIAFCPVQLPFPPYLPATMVLHAPFGMLSMDTAAVVYFAFSVAISILVVWLALRLSGARWCAAEVLLGAGILLLSRPGQWNLLLGQPALELTLATYAALYLSRRSPYASGLAASVAMFKPTFGLPLALLMLARRDFRAVGVAIILTIVVNLPPFMLLADRAGGPGLLIRQILAARSTYQTTNSPALQVYSVDLPSLISRFNGQWVGTELYVVIALVILGIAALALRAIPFPTEGPGAHLTASLISLAMLVGVHHNAYDLVLLVAPVILLAKRALPTGLLTDRNRLALLSLYALLGANYVTTLSVLHRLEPSSALWLILASINGALILTIFLTYATLAITRGGSVGGERLAGS